MHFGIKSVAEVVAERRNVVLRSTRKYTGSGASSRRLVQKIGEMTFFFGRCNTVIVEVLRTFYTRRIMRKTGDLLDMSSRRGREEERRVFARLPQLSKPTQVRQPKAQTTSPLTPGRPGAEVDDSCLYLSYRSLSPNPPSTTWVETLERCISAYSYVPSRTHSTAEI